MLRHVYPPDHKKAGQRKSDSDLTANEKRDREDWLALDKTRKVEPAKSLLAQFNQAIATLKSA